MKPAPAPTPVHSCPSCLRENAWQTVTHPSGVLVVCRFCEAVLATSARARHHFFEHPVALREAG